MKHIQLTNSSLLVLEKGEELHEVLKRFAEENDLKGAWLSGLGASSDLEIGLYDIEAREYRWKTYSEPLEILQLTGNQSVIEGEPFWHVHGSFSGRDLRAIGGHVKRLVVGVTCELHIVPLETELTRTYDESTGLKLLN